jgi:hypothetical protein
MWPVFIITSDKPPLRSLKNLTKMITTRLSKYCQQPPRLQQGLCSVNVMGLKHIFLCLATLTRLAFFLTGAGRKVHTSFLKSDTMSGVFSGHSWDAMCAWPHTYRQALHCQTPGPKELMLAEAVKSNNWRLSSRGCTGVASKSAWRTCINQHETRKYKGNTYVPLIQHIIRRCVNNSRPWGRNWRLWCFRTWFRWFRCHDVCPCFPKLRGRYVVAHEVHVERKYRHEVTLSIYD